MLRMRLSFDCGCVAVATQGVSDNRFTVEPLNVVGTAAECPPGYNAMFIPNQAQGAASWENILGPEIDMASFVVLTAEIALRSFVVLGPELSAIFDRRIHGIGS